MSISLHLAAQPLTLTGKVTEASTGKGLANVVVSIRPEAANKILKFATTKPDGTFEIPLRSLPEGKNVLHFAILGFANGTLPLVSGQTVYDIALNEKVTQLKTVNIKAPSIRQRGDTIAYSVASFADAGDKTLSEVLKKMPGIEVQDDGSIKYNGKNINKFYIEGHDMLGSRYTLASNNIHQEDVGTVEVMTNHQPIKALEDMVFSENPAINIKLKEKAKSRWVGTLKLGAGAEDDDLVWNAEVALMRFAKKTQSLNTLKSNNIGTDVTREVNVNFDDFDGGLLGKNYSLQNYINATPDRLFDISDSRVRNNRTHALTTNNLWALSATSDLTMQASYTTDRLTSSVVSSTQYFFGDTTIITTNDEHAKQTKNVLNVNLNFANNDAKKFITNKFTVDFQWNDVLMDIAHNMHQIEQDAAMPKYKFSDNFQIILRRGQKSYTFNTYNAYMRHPHSLTAGDAHQSVTSSAYFNHTHTSLGIYLNPFTISMEVGVQALNRFLESQLVGIADSSELQNDIRLTYARAYASPSAELNKGGWHITFKVPISLTPYIFNDHRADEKQTANKAQISPNLRVSYHFNPRLQSTISGGIRQKTVDEQNFFNGLIMSDYQNLYRGFVDFTTDQSRHILLDFDYKRPLAMFFINGFVSKDWTDSHLTTERNFSGDYIVNSYSEQKSKSEFLMAGGRISKGISFMSGLISVNYSYIHSDGTMQQLGTETNYTSESHTWGAKFNGRPARWFNFVYQLTAAKSLMSLATADLESSTTDLSQKLTLNFYPIERWQIKLIGDHFRNQISDNQHKNLYLADLSSSYTFSNGVELSFTALNLFDQRTYGYTINESLLRTSKEYQLRARMIMASVYLHF